MIFVGVLSMKNKKRLGFLSAVMGVCISVTSFSGVAALAEESQKYGVISSEAIKQIAFFKNEVDYFKDGEKEIDLESDSYSSLKLQVVKDTATLVEGEDYFYDDGEIIYGSTGDYEITLLDKDDKVVSETAKITVVGKDGVNAPVYASRTEKADEYKTFEDAIQKAADDLETTDTTSKKISVPDSYWDLLNLDVIDETNLRTTLYVANPKSAFSKKSTNVEKLADITVSASGTYAFYLEVRDCFGNEIKVDEDVMTQKVDGWYQTFDNGTPDDETDDYEQCIIPIFTFEYETVVKVEAKVESKVSKGVVGVEYNSGKLTKENASNVEIKLYYNANADAARPSVSDLDKGTNGWVEATSEEATFGDLSSSLRFTPLKKGAYVYRISAIRSVVSTLEGDDYEINGRSEVIKVTTSVQEQKVINVKFRNFVKNNWLSLIFLGIAFLCIVGIVILAFYKPKDAEEVKAQKKAKKAKVEDPVEETPAEEAEDAVEEAPAEEAPTEESSEEAPAEEAEQAEETPVEEAPVEAAPVEEAPAETPAEEVKPEGENA